MHNPSELYQLFCFTSPHSLVGELRISFYKDTKLQILSNGYQKHGHKFTRRKRQAKKNRKIYNFTWRINSFGRKLSKLTVDEIGNPVVWKYVGINKDVYIIRIR